MKTIILLFVTLFSNIASSQTLEPVEGIYVFPKYAMIIISGVVLALIFQLIFVILSVSLGISAMGDLRKKFVKASNHSYEESDEERRKKYQFEQNAKPDAGTGETISTAFGIWCTITTSLALLVATWLALHLATISTVGINITLALVIWAFFFLILFYLEIKFAQTVIGGLFSTVVSALKSTTQSITGIFKTSESQKMEDVLSNSITKLRKEFAPSFNMKKIGAVLDKFVDKVDAKLPDYDTLKMDIVKTVEAGNTKNNPAKWMAIQQILTRLITENAKDGNTNDNLNALQKMVKEFKEEYQKEDSVIGGAENVIAKHSNYSREEVEKGIDRFKKYLSGLLPEKLNTENITSELQKIIDSDETIGHALSENFGMNYDTIVQVLSDNTNLDKEQVDSYATTVFNAIDKTKETISAENLKNLETIVLKKVKYFLNMDPNLEFDTTKLKDGFVKVFSDPSESWEDVKDWMTTIDANSIKEYLVTNNLVSEDRVDSVTQTYEDAVKEMKDKITLIENKAHTTWEMTKRKAVIQAEHTRKTAALAAWWLLITILFSGGVSILSVYML
ncbi:hypothetical protein [Aequorivita capsosiphonis]|uniref:hypothetical protein n=1 Tax=Aequorivita capsosiphonis TaxID=487317 RepID=UPI00040E09A9|nr:hypothetical protein [Aequorivita capsosiphonis]